MATAATKPMMGKMALHSGLGASAKEGIVPVPFVPSMPNVGLASIWLDATAALWILSNFEVTTVERAVHARGVETQKRTTSAILRFRAWDIFMGNLVLFRPIKAPMTSLFILPRECFVIIESQGQFFSSGRLAASE